MIDFLLGLLAGAGAASLIFHFKGDPLKDVNLPSLEQRFRSMSQAADDLVAKLEAVSANVEAKIAAAAAPVQAQLEAEVADHQGDLSKLGQAVDALASKVA